LNNPIIFNDPTGHDAGFGGANFTTEQWLESAGYNPLPVSNPFQTSSNIISSAWNWWTGTSSNYQGSGGVGLSGLSVLGLPGHGLRQSIGSLLGFSNNDNAENIPQVLARSYLQYPSTTYTGHALEVLKNDAKVGITTSNIISYTNQTHKNDYDYHSKDNLNAWNRYDDNYIYFGGNSPSNIWAEGSYLVRSAHYEAHVEATNTQITIHYKVSDAFNVRPESYKGWVYNSIAYPLSFVLHDSVGLNDKMTISAQWGVTVSR
jgi:hypothetical protein